jgi:beta-glucanase (GH16 family)
MQLSPVFSRQPFGTDDVTDIARNVVLAALLITPAAFLSRSSAQSVAASAVPAGYELVWADEFDQPGLPDPARWTYDTERNSEGWWNGEAQYYAGERSKNARVEDGVLIIEAHRENLHIEEFPDWGGQNYTSSRLHTADRGEWTYGFIDVRAKLPCGRGSWPAIWTLGVQPYDHWPGGGEIDNLEHVGFEPEWVHASVNTGDFNHAIRQGRTQRNWLPGACDDFHNYQLTWTEDEILIGVDGENYFSFANDGRGDDGTWPFHRPQYLILNIAIGGGWGGRQGIDDEMFPIRMEVDYVRVYQARTHEPAAH